MHFYGNIKRLKTIIISCVSESFGMQIYSNTVIYSNNSNTRLWKIKQVNAEGSFCAYYDQKPNQN